MSVGKVGRSVAGRIRRNVSGRAFRATSTDPTCCCCPNCANRPVSIDLSWSGITLYSGGCCVPFGRPAMQGVGGAWTAGPYELPLAPDAIHPPFNEVNNPCRYETTIAVASPRIDFYAAGSCTSFIGSSDLAILVVSRDKVDADLLWDAFIYLNRSGTSDYAVVASKLDLVTADCATGGTGSVSPSQCNVGGTPILMGGTGTITVSPNMAP